MKKLIFILLIACLIFKLNAQTPITANILRQTYLIQTDTLQGTCFLIEENNQEYLITAKHLFKTNLKNKDLTKITIYQENKSLNLNVQYFVHGDNSVDVAVLKLNDSIKVLPPFQIEGNVILSQDIYFLGFPNLNNIQFSTAGTNGILPLVKKGIISGWVFTGVCTLFFLDGHNNPGFSGGPAICIDNSTHQPTIFGVISGYYFENKAVKNEQEQDEITHIQENSGIIKCFSTDVIKQILKNAK